MRNYYMMTLLLLLPLSIVTMLQNTLEFNQSLDRYLRISLCFQVTSHL
jgi:hypothetical protein